MKTCYIFAGAPMQTPPLLVPKADSLLLCADGGYAYAKALGLMPDCLVGDFDTWRGELPDCEICRHPVQKDDTDTMLAARIGIARSCTDFVIYGGIGGRLDHTLANLQTLCWLHRNGATAVLLGERDKAMLQSVGTRTYPREEGYFSVFAYEDDCTGVTLRGVEYPLTDATLTTGFPLGVSNHITAETATVSLKSGLLLLVFSKEA